MSAEVLALEPDQESEACRVLGNAFANDHMVRWPLSHNATPQLVADSFRGLVQAYISLRSLWGIGDSALEGVAGWLPPSEAAGFAAVLQASAADIGALTEDGGKRYDTFWAWVEEHLPSEPHWFLDFVGVDPPRQGTGLGSALIHFGLGRAAEDAVPAFLTTSNDQLVPYYEKYGFSIAEKSDGPDGGPTVWFMTTQCAASNRT